MIAYFNVEINKEMLSMNFYFACFFHLISVQMDKSGDGNDENECDGPVKKKQKNNS